jgi:hypothetical protein
VYGEFDLTPVHMEITPKTPREWSQVLAITGNPEETISLAMRQAFLAGVRKTARPLTGLTCPLIESRFPILGLRMDSKNGSTSRTSPTKARWFDAFDLAPDLARTLVSTEKPSICRRFSVDAIGC